MCVYITSVTEKKEKKEKEKERTKQSKEFRVVYSLNRTWYK